MPRRKTGLQLEALKRQQDELAKRIKEAEARHRQQQEADSERRCQLAGAVALDHAADDMKSPFAKTLIGLLNGSLRKAADRALFNLPPLPKPATDDRPAQPQSQPARAPAAAPAGTAPASRPQAQPAQAPSPPGRGATAPRPSQDGSAKT